MEKNTLNKVSALGVVAGIFALVVLSNPLSGVELNKAYGYGYGSSPVIPTIKDDCRVNGNCTKEAPKKEEPKKEEPKKQDENKDVIDPNMALKPMEKELNGKKYSYYEGVNKDVVKVLSDMSGFESKFKDISNSKEKEDIMRLEKAGIVVWTTPTTYEPNRAITRAEFLAIVMGAYGYDLTATAKDLPFGDVDMSSWQARVISAALDNNIIAGDTDKAGNKVFRPNSQISKIEALAIVSKISGIMVKDASAHSFVDAAADWQNAVLSNAEYLEVVSVPADKKFSPNAGISRADMAALIVKFARLY